MAERKTAPWFPEHPERGTLIRVNKWERERLLRWLINQKKATFLSSEASGEFGRQEGHEALELEGEKVFFHTELNKQKGKGFIYTVALSNEHHQQAIEMSILKKPRGVH